MKVRRMSWAKAISVGIVMVLLLGMLPAASMANGTTVMVQPGSDSIAVGGTTTVSVRIEGVTDLYGAEVHMTFSPSIVQVVDADGNSGNGVQVAAGDIFAGKNAFNALNAVNNGTGTIDYAISLLGEPAGITGAGNLFTITFRGVAPGLSAVAFSTVLLASRAGGQISASSVNGAVTVTGAPPATATPTSPAATATATSPAATATATATSIPGTVCTYVVQWGDTLYRIALRYNTTVSHLVTLNGLANPNYIRAGMTLKVPCVTPVTPVPVTPVPGTCSGVIYTVVSGDTLSSIARRYGVTLSAILAANYIPNPNYIWVGQKICIPGVSGPTVTPQPGCRAYYTVLPGDTLLGIAAKFGTTYWAIAIANNIPNPNLIFAGRTLCIP